MPLQLIDAFRSTLDETVDADLILHVIDAADPYMAEKIAEVEDVLAGLGVSDTPKVYVFNKMDAAKRVGKARLKKEFKTFTPVFVSAKTGEGMGELKGEIGKRV